jgi:choline-phosphate cytidylyltransferase
MVEQNKYVDEVFPHAPWILTEEFLVKNNIDFVCHDDIPYVTAGIDDAYAICKRLGKFKATERTKGISTTDVVAKILRNKEMYYVRNLRRGVPR